MKYKGLLTLTVLIAILFTGCQIKEFTKPTWDVTLNVPLMNKNYYVADLIDSVHFFTDANNTVIFQTSGEVQTEEVGNVGFVINSSSGNIPLLSGHTIQAPMPFSDTAHARELAYGMIASGRIWSQFSNINPVNSVVQVSFAEFRNSDNQALVIQYTGNTGLLPTDIDGYHVGLPNSNAIVDTIHVSIQVTSSQPDGTVIGSLQLSMYDVLSFSSFRGKLTNYPMQVEDNNTSINIDYPLGLENAIELQGASIHITLTNPIAFDCILHGDFYAIHDIQDTTVVPVSIPVIDENNNSYLIAGASGGVPAVTEINFTNQVNQLLRIMPERIELRNAYFVITNTDNIIGELTAADRIVGSYIADAPLTFILHDAEITPQDSVEIEISADNRDTIRKNIQDAQMDLFFTNHLPLGAEATVYFGANPNIDIADTTTWEFFYTAGIQSAQLSNGEQDPIHLSLSHENLMLFTNPKVYMKLTFSFEETHVPVTVTASPADYIRVRSMLKIHAHVEDL